ncbi:MAG: hypothetical protein IT318_07205 [Anaerolineales bacterium]|nr:hypothetical protein [Anaerolineales bacterium]
MFGYSNGGVFAAALGLRYPKRFGRVLAFSVGVSPAGRRAAFPNQPPDFYLLAGTLEEGFYRGTAAFADWLRSRGAAVAFHERVCGHDMLMWEEALPPAVGWAFGT